ncbi:MAG: elongation factor P [Pirellulales bacterium]|nr:elongation factor P [Pirellulales bacterium]
MLAKDLKPGVIINYQDAPHLIESVTVQTPSARGGSTLYKFRARNVVTRQKADFSMKGTDTCADADFHRREVKLMYSDGEEVYFLDQTDFNQYTLPKADIASQLPYITEDLEGVRVLIYNDQCVAIEIPAAVTLTVTQCDPGVKGNSATARTKPATLETGLVVNVPEYLKEGETIKVDTRTGEFLSRA